jgi:hypothetical protein
MEIAAPLMQPSVCPKCRAPAIADDKYCMKCGANMAAPVRQRLGNLSAKAHEKTLRSARNAIMVVAVLQLLFTIWMCYSFNSQVAALGPEEGLDAEVRQTIAQAWMQIYALFLVPVAFIGLWFWSKRNPFAATLTALIVFVTLHLVDAAVDPTALFRGILMKIIVVVLLVNGIKAGLAHRRMTAGDGA